jgi:Protein of unknown function (DUF3313)
MRQFQVFTPALLLLAGCAKVAQQAGITEHEMPVSGKGQLLRGTDIRASGFLQDYSQLAPVQGVKGEWEYVRKGVDWRPYTKIMMRPMEVWVNTGADYPAIQLDLDKKIEETVRQTVAEEFEAGGGYQIVSKPGPGANIIAKSYTITAEVEVPQGGGDRMIVTSGGRWGGFGLYLLNGKPVFDYNMLILAHYRWEGPQLSALG